LAFHQAAADELGGGQLGRAGEKALGKVLGEGGGYGSGFGGEMGWDWVVAGATRAMQIRHNQA